jgi:predicted transcriptional regulator
MLKSVVDEYYDNEKLRAEALRQTELTTNDTVSMLESEDVTLTSLRNTKVMEKILSGASKRTVARELGISEASVQKIVYSPQGRQQLSSCVARMNEQMAVDCELLVQQATNQLSNMMTSGDYNSRLATIDKVIGLWVKLNKINECNATRVTQSRTVKSEDGSIDKSTVSKNVTI